MNNLKISKSLLTQLKGQRTFRLGYTVSFNPELNIPNWVAWELNSSKLVEKESRAGHFYPDPDIPRGIAVETGDYSNSGYDRGHMCPAADNKWDKQAMRESFYMTNICPQHHNLNRGNWRTTVEDGLKNQVLFTLYVALYYIKTILAILEKNVKSVFQMLFLKSY